MINPSFYRGLRGVGNTAFRPPKVPTAVDPVWGVPTTGWWQGPVEYLAVPTTDPVTRPPYTGGDYGTTDPVTRPPYSSDPTMTTDPVTRPPYSGGDYGVTDPVRSPYGGGGDFVTTNSIGAEAVQLPGGEWVQLQTVLPEVNELQNVAPNSVDWNAFLGNLTQLIGTGLTIDAQRQLLRANIERAKAGLPPIDSSQYMPGVNVGLTSQTQKTVLLVAGIAAVALVMSSRKR